ncbi:MarR family winged helix-turn-helix transcriptional regulator [Streptomyces millisiae]|uniref:MarR family transcriptional regulator n=1 Tax=Streptomyces millisiae TaxID=3075542 RepID=A0ABU2LSB7_9ACTN|nr:MarR family transcriptional regulator [Streptomyces sp. DSM 44918]MDT0320485.1 MarR family transcriptional regulator [Streptomyces sp. DSM 44918]
MLLRRHATMGSFRKFYSGDRLERSAYVVLSRIEAEGPMSIGELADAFCLDTSTLNRQTAAMLRSGLLERIPDPEGGLARKLRITPDGERRLRADREGLVDCLGTTLGDWTREELAAFAALLTRYNTAVERGEGRPWPRRAGSGTAEA